MNICPGKVNRTAELIMFKLFFETWKKPESNRKLGNQIKKNGGG